MEIASFQFDLVAKDELRLPPYKGSAFRGLLGHALLKTVCVVNKLQCVDCLLRQNCAYAYLFETFNDRNEKVAHPFLIEPPLTENTLYPAGDLLKVNVILMGRAIDYLPYIIHTFREMGKRGIGYSRGKFWVKEVYLRSNGVKQCIYNQEEQTINTRFERLNLFGLPKVPTEQITIQFITPTAIKVNNQVSRSINFEILIKTIIRRLKALSYYHNGRTEDLFKIDFERVQQIRTVSENLRPYYWERLSNRQKQKIGFEGFVGEIQFEGDLTPFSHLLAMGEHVHIGRGTVYGMGMYRMTI